MPTDATSSNIQIPKKVFWTVFFSLIGIIAGSYINTAIQFVRIEKEMALMDIKYENNLKILKFQVEKDMEILQRIEKKIDENQLKIIDIEKTLILKQDKKFQP